MGIETILGAVAAPLVGGVVGKVLGNSGSQPTGTQTTTTQQKLDPQIQELLFGTGKKTLKAGAVPIGEDERGKPIYGADAYETNKGLLSQYQELGKAPQAEGLKSAGLLADQYLGSSSYGNDLAAIRQGATGLLANKDAPQMQAANSDFTNYINAAQSKLPDQMKAAQIGDAPEYNATTAAGVAPISASNATAATVVTPAQGSMDLSNAYNSFINGESGNNPYLTGAIQKGINQSNNAFSNMTQDAAQTVQDALASIRGGAISSGQYGGSRQGLAESRSIGELAKNLTRAASQYGQNNTDAAVAAQAGQYNNDQQMKLNALNTLSGQQFGMASQNASMGQQAALQNAQMQQQAAAQNAQMGQQNNQFNSGLLSDAAKTNAGMQQANNTNNAQLQQQANQTNYTSALNNNQFNAANQQQANLANNSAQQNMAQFNTGLQQQANQQNLGAQLQTNGLNSQNTLAGMGALQGVMGNQYTMANNQNNYEINRAQQMNGLLSPYLSANQSSTQSTPTYTNPTANVLGGAALGQQLYNAFSSPSQSTYNPTGGNFGISNQNSLYSGQSGMPSLSSLNLGSMPSWNFG